MTNLDPLPSKSRINRAGHVLAAVYSGEEPDPRMSIEDANAILDAFRGAHEIPLTAVRAGLRRVLADAGVDGVTSQRLKRAPRIVRKLARMRHSMLARLEDVGGARIIVPSAGDAASAINQIRAQWSDGIVRERDYVSEPNSVGYRAHHLVAELDQRRIEIQVRTVAQQHWASQVEMVDARWSMAVKDGVGPPEVLEFFQLLGEMCEAEDAHRARGMALRVRLDRSRSEMRDAGYDLW